MVTDQVKVKFHDLGLVEYKTAWDLQENLLQENVNRKRIYREMLATENGSHHPDPDVIAELPLPTEHFLLFVEHPPVFTLGKSGNPQNILVDIPALESKGIGFYKTNRGGDITFHGPQQVVGYPILDLEKFFTDIGRYLRNLEEVVILTIAEYGLDGKRSPGETGVWLDPDIPGKERKICALGVRCSRWITMHGFAFNVNTDLSYFDYIIPCGIANKQVTSLQRELGRSIQMEEVKDKLKRNFEKVFSVNLMVDGTDLRIPSV